MDPNAIRFSLTSWPQVLCAVAAGMAAALQGTCMTFPSRALTMWEQETDPNLQMTLEDVSWFASLHLACAILCCPLGGLISNHFGRRKVFIVLSIPCITGWALIGLAQNKTILFAGKILTAVGSTTFASSIGAYISETAHPDIRGSLAVFQSLFLSLGMLIVFGCGYFVGWRTLAWLCALPGVCLLAFMIFLPETPYWLVEKDKIAQARSSLQFLRGPFNDVHDELNEMLLHSRKRMIANSSVTKGTHCCNTTLRRLISSSVLKPFSCVGFLSILLQWGGINILMTYMVNVFRGAKSSIDPELAPVFVGLVRVASAALSSVTIRRFPQRILFTVCMTIVSLGNLSIATFSFLNSQQEEQSIETSYLDSLGWMPLTVVILMLCAHSLGCLPVIHSLSGELYPTDIKPLCLGLSHAISSTIGVINIKTYPYQLETLKFFGTFYLYAFATFVALLLGAFTIPDNRGLSLVKVEEKYESQKMKDHNSTVQVLIVSKT